MRTAFPLVRKDGSNNQQSVVIEARMIQKQVKSSAYGSSASPSSFNHSQYPSKSPSRRPATSTSQHHWSSPMRASLSSQPFSSSQNMRSSLSSTASSPTRKRAIPAPQLGLSLRQPYVAQDIYEKTIQNEKTRKIQSSQSLKRRNIKEEEEKEKEKEKDSNVAAERNTKRSLSTMDRIALLEKEILMQEKIEEEARKKREALEERKENSKINNNNNNNNTEQVPDEQNNNSKQNIADDGDNKTSAEDLIENEKQNSDFDCSSNHQDNTASEGAENSTVEQADNP